MRQQQESIWRLFGLSRCWFGLCTRFESAQRYKKSLSPTKCGKRHLKTDSFCAIIAQGIQVSRVPSQIRYICRGTASSNGLASGGRSRGAYSFVHLYYITFTELLQGFFRKILIFLAAGKPAAFCISFLFSGYQHDLLLKVSDVRMHILFESEGHIRMP